MKNILLLSFLLVAFVSFGQERVNSSDVHNKKGNTHLVADNKPYTGIVEYRTAKGHLVFKKLYENGYQVKYTEYYNGLNVIVAREIYYHDKSSVKKKEIKYPCGEGPTFYKHFDTSGQKILEETFNGEILTYSCEFRSRKKHGKVFCTKADGSTITETYEDGKRITRF